MKEIQEYEKDHDAREVSRKLLDFATNSAAAELNKDGLVNQVGQSLERIHGWFYPPLV